MRLITFLIIALCITPAHAKIYKCETNGKISFQQTPCQATATSREFVLKKDISIERQQQAAQKLADDLAKIASQKKQAQAIAEKERRTRTVTTQDNTQTNTQQESIYQTVRPIKLIKKHHELIHKPALYPKQPKTTFKK